MGVIRLKRGPLVALLGISVLFGLNSASIASPVLDGDSVTAVMQPLDPSCGIMNQFVSPQIVGPGVEFTGGQFTPNAGGAPYNIQQINSIGMDVDITSAALAIMFDQIPGSITGIGANYPVLRLNVSGLQFPGRILTGLTQTSGGAPLAAFVTGPNSVAIDFSSIGAPSALGFDLQSAVPEPTSAALLFTALALTTTRRARCL